MTDVVDDARAQMLRLSQMINEKLNPERQLGLANKFVLLVIPAGGEPGLSTNHVTNVRPQEAVAAMKEVIARLEGRTFEAGWA